jgi:predicted glycoside hydrolase/deacetylase ChbG (UPF0249 family)
VSAVRLIVQADDLGMCHAVNAGIERAFRDGIATQTSVMAACPWIAEGIDLVLRDGLPAGVHCTLTCEWEHLRWGPLTDGASLRAEDGGFPRTVEAVTERADPEEATAEFAAQTDRLIAAGIDPLYFDMHMGPTCPPAFAEVAASYGRPFMYRVCEPYVPLDSVSMLSPRSAGQKLDWMLGYLQGLGPGTHFLCTHPAVKSEELRAVTPEDADNHVWTEHFRATDLDTLCDPVVRDSIERLGIQLVSVADLG